LGGSPTLAATASVLGTVVISQGIPVLHAQTGVIPVVNDINKAWGVVFILDFPFFVVFFPKVPLVFCYSYCNSWWLKDQGPAAIGVLKMGVFGRDSSQLRQHKRLK
jgi:hypothetical protein